MAGGLDSSGLDLIFYKARTRNAWQDKAVDPSLLRRIWALAAMGPTSANCSPARIVFAVSAEAKEKLKPCLIESNIEKTMTAPVTAIIGYDLKFYERLPQLFPHDDARSWFAGNETLIQTTAFRNGTLQGAYFIIAARSVGLDCGPISGFDNDAVDAAFFAGTVVRSNFLCNVGYGSDDKLFPRSPRLAFNDACQIV